MTESRPSGRIFINYRREETDVHAAWLYDLLTARFGGSQVFKDRDNIKPGDDFHERLSEAVGSCDVLLALVGKEWSTIKDAEGTRRLDNPNDFVRIELAAALKRRIRVIPLLVGGAVMPTEDELPPDLVRFARHQAQELSGHRFREDAGPVLDVIEETLADVAREQNDGRHQDEPEVDGEDETSGGGTGDSGGGSEADLDERPTPPRLRPLATLVKKPLLVGTSVVVAATVIVAAILLGDSDPNPPEDAEPKSAATATSTASETDSSERRCWDGDVVPPVEPCPPLEGLDALKLAYPWHPDYPEPQCRPDPDLPERTGEREVFICEWPDLDEKTSYLKLRSWDDVASAKAFGEPDAQEAHAFLMELDDETEDVGFRWTIMRELEGDRYSSAFFYLYDELPMSASAVGVGKTASQADANRDKVDERFLGLMEDEVADLLDSAGP